MPDKTAMVGPLTNREGALNALLPDQTAQGGKFLKTTGTTHVWDSAAGPHTHPESDITNLVADLSSIEMEYAFRLSFPLAYKEMTYETGNLMKVELWETAAKLVKLFTKTLAYLAGKVKTITIVRASDNNTVVRTLGYTGEDLTSITRS